MSKAFCKWCGVNYPTIANLVANTCSRNPEGKYHALYEGSEKSKYSCKFCGVSYPTIGNLTASSCQKSPNKKHQPAL